MKQDRGLFQRVTRIVLSVLGRCPPPSRTVNAGGAHQALPPTTVQTRLTSYRRSPSDPRYPTHRHFEMEDPLVNPPPRGVMLLVANEGGHVFKSPWYDGAIAWQYLPKIPKSVKERQSARYAHH